MEYSVKGISDEITGTLYECCAALRDDPTRTVGAIVHDYYGRYVAFYCHDTNTVRAVVDANYNERAEIKACNV